MTFFKPHEWLSLLRKPRQSASDWEAECLRLLTTEATCRRCCATARAMDYARHQWIAAGIDRE
jgi:hypothetical protein